MLDSFTNVPPTPGLLLERDIGRVLERAARLAQAGLLRIDWILP